MQVNGDLSCDPFGFLWRRPGSLEHLALTKLPGAYKGKPNGHDFTVQKQTQVFTNFQEFA